MVAQPVADDARELLQADRLGHEAVHARLQAALDVALQRGAGPEVTTLATAVKAAQGPEIAQMHAWLTTWGASHSMDHGDMHAGMPGMMTDAQMTDLRNSSGEVFDRTWLEMMIVHHEGAISMAKGVLPTTSDAEVRKLAEAVVAGQTAEIAEMKGHVID